MSAAPLDGAREEWALQHVWRTADLPVASLSVAVTAPSDGGCWRRLALARTHMLGTCVRNPMGEQGGCASARVVGVGRSGVSYFPGAMESEPGKMRRPAPG